MPTKSNDVDVLVDTSVAIAFLFEDHAHHTATLRAVGDRSMGFAGHAAFETFSVMTRMPPPARLSPAAAVHLMNLNFPSNTFLTAVGAEKLLAKFASLGIAGGSVYDALVRFGGRRVRFGSTYARCAGVVRLPGP